MKDFQDKLLSKSHQQNQLEQLSEEDSEQVRQQGLKEQFYPSELTQSAYKNILAGAQSLTLQEMSQRLRCYDIQFKKSIFSNGFQKHCIKTDWESTVYQIKYGNFKTNFKIIVMKMEPKMLCNQFLSKGSFGEVLSLELQKNKCVALKNIKFNPELVESLDLALRQVFMAKIFSAIEFGPKFLKIFSYDAIIYEGSVQFAMEMCDKNYTKENIESQIHNKTLLKELKSMHKLKICHLDIKYDNIGWSPTFQKFIFLDFSFTINIRQPIGYKTMTKFVGTYNYSSPEMKKLFFLKQSSYIDLYYNDLFGLEEVWKDFALNRIKKSQQCVLPSKTKENSLNSLIIENNWAIVRYFEAKISVFDENYSNLREIIQKEKVLIKTFRKITEVNQSPQRDDSSQFKILHNIACNNPEQLSQESESKIDQILFAYEMEKQSKHSATSFFQTILKVCDSDSLFLKLWEEQLWKQRIFFFIDPYSNPDKQQLRKKLIEKIYLQVEKDENKLQPISYTMKFRGILLFYSEFFYAKKNTVILEKIMTYFSLLKDYASFEKIENFILELWEKEEKFDEYLRQNFKYFIGKVAIVPRLILFKPNINIQKMKSLQQKIKQNQQKFDREILKKTHKIIDLMLIIQNLQTKIYSESWNTLAKLQIKQSLDLFNFGIQINQFLDTNFFNKPSQPGEIKRKEFTSIYLQKCSFQAELQMLLRLSKVITYKNLVENDDLCKQFPLFLKTPFLSMEREGEKNVILGDYVLMNKGKGLIIDSEYFYALCFSKSHKEAFEEVVLFLNSFQIEKLNNLQKIFSLKIALPLFLTTSVGLRKLPQFNVPKQTIKNLNDLGTTILETTSNIENFRGKCQFEQPLLEILNQQACKDSFKLNHQLFTVSLLLSKGREQEALDFIFQATQQSQKFLIQILKINLLNLFNEQILQKKFYSSQEKVLKAASQYLQKSLAEYFLQQPKFLINILEIYRIRSQFNQIIVWMSKLYEIIHVKKQSVLRVKFAQVVEKIIKKCSNQELEKMIKEGTSMEMKFYSNCPGLIYFLALAWFKLQSSKIKFNQKNRLVIICAAFLDNLKQGHFRKLKDYITYQVQFLQLNKPQKMKRTKKLIHSHNLKDFINNIKHKNVSRLTMEAIRESLRIRIKLVLKNRIEVHEVPYNEIFEARGVMKSYLELNSI